MSIHRQGKSFDVEAGSLSFSVVIYTVTASICIAILMLRRYVSAFGKAELGGNKVLKIVCALFFVFMWVMYILLSALQAYGHINAKF
jgi:solute carrier family 8 (sodium/calcium exchanger)